MNEQDLGNLTVEQRHCFEILVRIRTGLNAIIDAQRAEAEALDRFRTTLRSGLDRLQRRLDEMSIKLEAKLEAMRSRLGAAGPTCPPGAS